MSGPKGAAKSLARLSFGLTLLLAGVAYLMKLASFTELMGEGLTNTQFAFVAPVAAYALPVLMIVGGFLYVVGFLKTIAAWCAGLALGLFPVLMMLKAVVSPAIEPTSVMPFVIYGLAWLVIFQMVTPKGCHGGCCGSMAGCACGKDGCDCGMEEDKPKKVAVKKPTAKKSR